MSALSVDLWHWPLTDADPQFLNLAERERAARFVFDHDRDHFIAARSTLRQILARYLSQDPAKIAFVYGKNGKPRVDGLEFNLSHSGGFAALAVGQDASLGLDIEVARPIGMEVARAHFAPREVDALTKFPEHETCDAFYRCWTRKEAYLKAVGTGLMTDLNSFVVTLDADDPRLVSCKSGAAKDWTLLNVVAPEECAGALAVHTEGRAVEINERSL